MRRIASRVGCTATSLYLYFKNKDDLLISVFEDRMESILEFLKSALAEEDAAPGRLRRFIELHLGLVQRDRALAEVLAVELRQSAKFVREYKARKFYEYLTVAEDILNEGISEGIFRSGINPKIYRRALFGALDEISVMWVTSIREGIEPDYLLSDAVEDVYNLFLTGLRPRATEQMNRSDL